MPQRLTRLLQMGWGTPALLLTLVMLMWSVNILVGRAVAGHIPPIAMAQMRWSLALLILLPFAWTSLRKDWPVVRKHLGYLALLGVLSISGYNTLLYYALNTTTAINAAILAAGFPTVIAAIGFLLYRDRLTPTQAVGICATTAGAALVLSGGDISVFVEFRFVPGDLWVLGAQLAYATYTVILRERPAIHPNTFLLAITFFGQLFLIPFAIGEGLLGARVTFDAVTVATILYVAIFPALVAFALFNRAVALIGSNRTAPYFNLVPIFTVLGAMLLLGEMPTAAAGIGWLIIISGIWLAQRKRPEQEPAR